MKTTANPPALALLNLNIEPAADGKSVLLEQDIAGDVQRVSLHSSQVRALVEELGLNWPETDRLKRALLRACSLIDRLHRNLVAVHGAGHEDLTMEVQQALALADFLSFECQPFADDYEEIPRVGAPPSAPPAVGKQLTLEAGQ